MTYKKMTYKKLSFQKMFILINQMIQLINKYNKTYYKTTKTTPVDLKSNTGIDDSKTNNSKNPKFKNSDIARISKYKNMFAKDTIIRLIAAQTKKTQYK